jgi:heavy metal translocating P-type ATPase
MHQQIWSFLKTNPLPFFALLGLVGGAGAQWGFQQPAIAEGIWLVTLGLGGAPLVWGTLRGILHGQFASDVVAMLAIVGALVMDEPFAGVIVVLMQSGGEALENYGFRRASSSLESLMARAPRSAWRKQGDHLEEIPAVQVQVGDALVVRPGELIPVDGALLSDEATVDESALTGEPLAHDKHRGDPLLSGSVNAGGALEMRATAVSEASQYARIVELVRRAHQEKAPIERLADRYAIWFTPITLLMCGLGWAITGDPHTIVAVLVVATPCPLILATPIAIISGINRAARAGIIVKSGVALEQIGHARAVLFDKTGTLTYGLPVLECIVPANGIPPAELLRKAASVEQLSSHLLGRTLTQAAQAAGGAVAGPLPLSEQFQEVPGRGVAGQLDGQSILVGSARFLTERLGTAPMAGVAQLPMPTSTGAILSAYIAIDQKLAGVALFGDRLRPGVPELMDRLRALGVRHIALLTGDRLDNAPHVAQAARIDEVAADLLPADKVAVVQRLKAQYAPVVMIGDGINDAPALATATVGVAMGAHGTGISAEAADVVLLVDDITRVGEAVTIGQHTLHIARQSIIIGLGLSFLLMVVASLGLLPPPVGALCQEVIDVMVILNALRAR